MFFWWREKNQETLMCVFFFWCFLCLKEGKTSGKIPGREQKLRKMSSSQVWGVPRAIYSPSTNFKVVAFVGPPASNFIGSGWSWNPWKGFDFLFLKRYGTWKSNDRIKSYGSQKLVVHRSMHHPGFRDILAVLTLVSTHEQSLEWESDNLCNSIGFNPFWQPDQN